MTDRASDDLELLERQFHTLFRSTADGRISGENDPDATSGPMLWLAGCVGGNRYGLHERLAAPVAADLAELLADEPPVLAEDATPRHLERYRQLTGGAVSFVLNFGLPHDLDPGGVEFVSSHTEAGRELLARFAAGDIPPELFAMGFRTAADLWAPWCAVLHDGQPAALAFAARLCDVGAEVGLVTAPSLRGRGYGRAATAAWSGLPELSGRALFYGTDRTNAASRGVAASLGLRRIGTSLRFS